MGTRFDGGWKRAVLGLLAWAGCVPALATSAGDSPSWVSLSGTTATGRFELEWAPADAAGGALYRLDERGPAGDYRYYIEGERHAFFRAEPGRYRFRVAACRRVDGGAPTCGRWSGPLTLDVTGEFLDQATRAAAATRVETALAVPQSVPGLRPGAWYDPDRAGHGWTFYRVNPMAVAPGDPWFGAAYDAIGVWYTYEAAQRFITSEPGEPVQVEFADYRPVWLLARLVSAGEGRLEGSLFRRRLAPQADCAAAAWYAGVCEEQVGAVSLDYPVGGTSATITWNASFPLQGASLAGQALTQLLPASGQAGVDHPGHHSGLWQPERVASLEPAEVLVVETIAPDFEGADLLFFDDAGAPAWMSHQQPATTVPTSSPLCFAYVAQGYAPDQLEPAGWDTPWLAQGCDPASAAGTANRNGWRAFVDLERAQFGVDASIPAGIPFARSGRVVTGAGLADPAHFEKTANRHRIAWDGDLSGCELTDAQPQCAARFSWRTDGDYPQACAALVESSTGQRIVVGTLSGPAVAGEAVSFDAPGDYRLDLHAGPDATGPVIARSGIFPVTDSRSGPALPVPFGLSIDWLDERALAYVLSWSAATLVTVSHWDVEERTPAGTISVRGVSPAVTTTTRFDRPEGPFGDYAYRVRACGANGCGAWSPTLAWELLAPEPPEPPATPESPPAPAPSPGLEAGAVTSSVGEARGHFTVDDSGRAYWSLPILTAPAPGRFAPSIGVSYASRPENGPLGVGTSLEGLSSIGRCPPTIEQDGAEGSRGVTLTGSDRFCLDGQRLLRVDGGSVGGDQVFRTEVDTHAQITAFGVAGQGPAWFRVSRRDGVTLDYGSTADSRIEARAPGDANTVLMWLVAREVDRFGNEIRYRYLENAAGPVDVVPDVIEYGGNPAAGTPATSRIQFVWQGGREDSLVSFAGGAAAGITTSRLLERIDSLGKARADDDTSVSLRSYRLGYGTDAFGRAILERVDECRSPAAQTCFGPTRLHWNTARSALRATAETLPRWSEDALAGLALGDINGDGRPDPIVTFQAGRDFELTWVATAADGRATEVAPPMPLPKAGRLTPVRVNVIDLDADGYDDALYAREAEVAEWVVRRGSPGGLGPEVAVGPAGPLNPAVTRVLDFDGDGLADLLHNRPRSDGTGNELVWLRNLKRADGSWGLADPVPVNISVSALFPAGTDDGWFLSDEHPNIGVNQDSAAGAQVFDFNADGRVDLLARVARRYERCTKNCESVAMQAAERLQAAHDDPAYEFEAIIRAAGDESAAKGGRGGSGGETGLASYWVVLLSTGNGNYELGDIVAMGADCSVLALCELGSGLAAALRMQPVDLNGDGLADLVEHDAEGHWAFRINQAGRFSPATPIATTTLDQAARVQLRDWDSDGLVDFLYPSATTSDDATWRVHLNHRASSFGPASVTGVRANPASSPDQGIFADFDGDTREDLLYLEIGDSGAISDAGLHAGIDAVNGGRPVNHVVSRFDFALGGHVEIDYARLTSSAVYRRFNDGQRASWGHGSAVFDVVTRWPVVATVRESAPVTGDVSATLERRYFYAGAKLQAGGRGFLGFRERVEYEPQRGMRNHVVYRQAFPFTGRVVLSGRAIASPAGATTLISDPAAVLPPGWGAVDADYAFPAAAGGWLETRISEWSSTQLVPNVGVHQVSRTATLDRRYTLGGATAVSEFRRDAYDDFGNVVHAREEIRDGDAEAPYQVTETTREFSPTWAFGLNLGLPATERITRSRAGTSSVTRETAYGYDEATGGMLRETREPDRQAYRVVTDYRIDAFGNRTRVTVTGEGMPSRIRTASFDALGRFEVSASNAYGQVTRKLLDWDAFGNPLAEEDIEGVLTVHGTDRMGRPYGSYRETGSWTIVRFDLAVAGVCPAQATHRKVTHMAGHPETFACLDPVGREVRRARRGDAGRWVFIDTRFDRLGRVVSVSEPRFEGAEALWTHTAYDELDRVLMIDGPDGRDTLFAYDASAQNPCVEAQTRITRETDALGRDRVTLTTPTGEPSRVFDETCAQVAFTYDAWGQPASVRSPLGGFTTTTYDAYGRKVRWQDPDRGTWQYVFNALGEPVRQLDGKGQAIDFGRDLEGRVTVRTERIGVDAIDASGGSVVNTLRTSYENATASHRHGKGQRTSAELRQGASGTVRQRVDYAYDAFGRIDEVTTVAGGDTHVERTTYDQFGRLFQKFDASGDHFGLRFSYEDGATQSVREAREGPAGTVYHAVLERDARGQVTAFQLGNGVTVLRSFDAVDGSLRRQEAYTANGELFQDVETRFDLVGNLVERIDRSSGSEVTETFHYDSLDRLVDVFLRAPAWGHIQEIGTLSLAYDAGGNIVHRSGLGGLAYGGAGAGPHAVTLAGGHTYAYDANGNQVAGAGRQIEYTVSDQASRIQRERDGFVFAAEFSYGVDGDRYRRVDRRDGNELRETVYVGSVERITEAGQQRYRRHVPGAGMVDVDPSSGQRTVHYVLRDHRGSVHTILDEQASAVSVRFGPFGERVLEDTLTPPSGAEVDDLNQLTSRGFTGHEHVDAVGVIHMNGRIYDPALGRFLQADPFVQEPLNSQSLNRYSYALNNPLSMTDPSGYFFKRLIRKWGRLILGAVAGFYTYGWASTWALDSGAAFLSGSVGSAAAGGAASGFVSGAIVTGNLKGAVTGSISGATTAGVAGYFGDTYSWRRVLADGLAGGIASELHDGDFKSGLLSSALVSSATLITVSARASQLAKSRSFPGQVGESPGIRGLPGKLGGERTYLELWESSGAADAVARGESASSAARDYYLKAKRSLSPLGGFQGGPGLVFGVPYQPGGFVDYVIEGYSGVHDFLNEWFFYTPMGTNRVLSGGLERALGPIINPINVLLATPIVLPALIPDHLRHLGYAFDP